MDGKQQFCFDPSNEWKATILRKTSTTVTQLNITHLFVSFIKQERERERERERWIERGEREGNE